MDSAEQLKFIFERAEAMVSGYFDYVITTSTLAVVVAGWFFASDKAQHFLAPNKFLKWLLTLCMLLAFCIECMVTWKIWAKSNALINAIGEDVPNLSITPIAYEGAALSTELAVMILLGHLTLFGLLTAAVWKTKS